MLDALDVLSPRVWGVGLLFWNPCSGNVFADYLGVLGRGFRCRWGQGGVSLVFWFVI